MNSLQILISNIYSFLLETTTIYGNIWVALYTGIKVALGFIKKLKQKHWNKCGRLRCSSKTPNWATLEEQDKPQEAEAENEAVQCVRMVLRIGSTKKTGKNIPILVRLSCCKCKPQHLFGPSAGATKRAANHKCAARYDNHSGANYRLSSAHSRRRRQSWAGQGASDRHKWATLGRWRSAIRPSEGDGDPAGEARAHRCGAECRGSRLPLPQSRTRSRQSVLQVKILHF